MLDFEDRPSNQTADPAHQGSDAIGGATGARDSSTGWFWLFGLIGLLLGLTAALLAWAVWGRDDTGLTQADIDLAVASALDERAREPSAASIAYDRIATSLVGIRATSADSDEPAAIGSGVLINDQGQILTSLHIVEAADAIELLFPNGGVGIARIESTDPALDIAVLSSTPPRQSVPAALGDARSLQIGDEIFAVGNPLGLSGSLSAGVISGLDRNLPFPDSDDDAVLEGLIQFDAAVNQGSSGGPLLNANGEVIGIVTALADPGDQGFFIGIGFAVPIDLAIQQAG